ncbi:MAG: class I SAM-dependent methyltransferase [Burkholderiales bacterium]
MRDGEAVRPTRAERALSFLDRLRGRHGATTTPQPEQAQPAPAAPEHVWEYLDAPSGSHLYFLNPDHVQKGLVDLLDRPPRTVLDVGCYCGATGALIRQRWPQAAVVGIEPLAEAAAIAATRIDRVVVGKFEDIDHAAEGLTPGSFDVIVLADVLEHMYNPWRALTHLRRLLADGGVVLASIPNVRNLGLILSLVGGHWTYAGGGLLDVTHIRFFTLAEIRKLFAETGFEIEHVEHNVDPSLSQLWDAARQGGQPTIRAGQLAIDALTTADMQELATVQFYVRASVAPTTRDPR